MNCYRAELDASDAVTQLVQRRRPTHDAHDVGNHQQDPACDTRFSRQTDLKQKMKGQRFFLDFLRVSKQRGTHVESELPGEVVHAAGMHQTQSVPHGLRAQHALPCDWTEAPVGERRRHDAGALAGHLDGAQLTRNKRRPEHSNTWRSFGSNRSPLRR